MRSSRFFRGVLVFLACACAAILLPDCSQEPQVGISPGVGGAGGEGGGQAASASAEGGAIGSGVGDASIVSIKLDVPPAWWGEKDAPQEPDLPAAPTVDSNCGIITSETTRQPVDVLLVLDRSASMDYSITEDCYCSAATATYGSVCADTTGCTTRWNAIKPAVTTTLSNSSYVNWGLKFFASPNSANCVVTDGVEVEIGPGTAGDVEAQINSATLSLSTPTAAALSAATAYLQGVQDLNKKFILLATDGEPNCGGAGSNINTVDVTGAAAAAAAANAAGFPVYVVGIGPNLGNLTQLAASGGTTDFYPVSSSEQLSEALTAIGKKVGSCSFMASEEPPDPENIAVYVNKQKVEKDASNGWTFGATPQEIQLTGTYCDDITAGNDTAVQILFGCPGAPPFPPFVP